MTDRRGQSALAEGGGGASVHGQPVAVDGPVGRGAGSEGDATAGSGGEPPTARRLRLKVPG